MADDLIIHVYAPTLAGERDRALAAVHGLERAFPSVRLAWDISPEGRPVALPRRDEWLTAEVTGGNIPLLCNGDETYPVIISGHEISAASAPGGRPQLDIYAELPLDVKVVAAAADVLEGIADGARGFWGTATPGPAAVEIALQTFHRHVIGDLRFPQSPPRGLPWLKLPEELSSPEIPNRLGWLNYWSVAAAAAIGFPDPARDADLLARARRTAAGAWIVRLTDEPLDLDNPAHLNALRRTYDRFPAMGGRSLP
jgi:hypothetical protein